MRPFLLLIMIMLLIIIEPRPLLAQESLAQQTVVLCNAGISDSVELAKFYAQKRGIARDHLIPLDCSGEEEITRDEYETSIADPVRATFEKRKWWQLHTNAEGQKRVETSTIHFVAVMKGVPLKIKPTATPYPGDKPGEGAIQSRNEACVDSELAALGLFTREISGALNNFYYQSYKPIAEFSGAPILLVSRLDAPEAATVRRMITDAIEAEKTGLWGRAYVDGAHNTAGGFAVGDAWLANVVEQLHKVGVPVVYEDTSEIFPQAFPMSDCALYYGWYAGGISGPFNQPGFQFVPGAIAIHIHSYSAVTLRDPNGGWSGPLLARGAAATVGNVYEPYLQLTTNLDVLNDRLLHGFTWAESAWMASRVLSWMGVALGDPLYRPYFNWTQIDSKNPAAKSDWRAYHEFARKNSQLAPAEFSTQARVAASRAHNAPILEDIALMQLRDGNFSSAISGLQQARAYYTRSDDILRCVLEECDALTKSGKPKRAADLANSVLRVVPDAPASELLRKIAAPRTSPPATATP